MLIIDTLKIKTHHVLYTLSDLQGKTVHVGIAPYSQLMAFQDAPPAVSSAGQLYLAILGDDADRGKLINHGMRYCDENNLIVLRDRLVELFKSWAVNKKERAIFCVETGETFESAVAASKSHDLTYNALIKHLNGEKSYNSVKGKTYKRC